jgi:putative protease
MEKKEVGRISHFFGKIMVAAIKVSDTIRVGDRVSIEGSKTNFEQTIDSMQIENESIEEAKSGDEIGVKVSEKVREGDTVYKVIE